MRIIAPIFLLVLISLPAEAVRYFELKGSRLNMRPDIGKKPVCTLKQGDELMATDFKFVNGRPWCKMVVLSSEGKGSCEPGQEAYTAGWLVKQSKTVAATYEPGSLKEDAPAYCVGLYKNSISNTHFIGKGSENTISLNMPVKMRRCNKEMYGKGDCNCRGVSDTFRWRESHPVLKKRAFHRGLDIGYPSGTPIYAAADGVVTMRTTAGGYGRIIKIEHFDQWREEQDQIEYDNKGRPSGVVDGQAIRVKACGMEKEVIVDEVSTSYAHLKGFADGIKVGSIVKKGQLIGYGNNSGTSSGDHLHYETNIDTGDSDLNCHVKGSRAACDPSLFTDFPQVTPRWTRRYHCSMEVQ